MELDEGKYVVQVRIDRKLVKDKDAPIPIANLPATRKLAQKRTEQLLSASIAASEFLYYIRVSDEELMKSTDFDPT